MQRIRLVNGVEMPSVMMGTSVDDKKGDRRSLVNKMATAVRYAVEQGVVGFDTARDYSNETVLGEVFNKLIRKGEIAREELFLTTKVGNGQQRKKDMEKQIDISLKALKVEYIDLWLLHWPLPDYYIDNWIHMCEIYKSGKVRAIGIANCRERHILELESAGVEILPHVVQVEYHPFRNIPTMRHMCENREIHIEAYSANCLMLPMVRECQVLNEIALKYEKSISQIIMRWHVQQGVIPIFSSMNCEHIKNNIDVFDFSLSEQEMERIFSLNREYKFHPESLNCPGY